MRILWITSKYLSHTEDRNSGVWVKSLGVLLAKNPGIKLMSITVDKNLSIPEFNEYENILQWKIPLKRVNKKGYPDAKAQYFFYKIVNSYSPDIIHIWGSENPLRLFPFDSKIPGKKVLAMQGVLSSIAPVVWAGLRFRDVLSTLGLREIITRNGVFFDRKSFAWAGEMEIKMIKKSEFIITQSAWTESQIKHFNPSAVLYRIERPLRLEFLSAAKWSAFEHPQPIIYSAAIGYSIKGLHVLIEALKIVKNNIPSVMLHLAGGVGRLDFLGDGYLRWIRRLIEKYRLERNVVWLGAISANDIIKQLQHASVFVNPSFIESYSLALSEAMYIGTPSVVSFAGAMPELADNNVEALFFSPGDYKRCADLIETVLTNETVAKKLSQNAIQRAKKRNNSIEVANRQIDIYRDILNA